MEIERKFLVRDLVWKVGARGRRIRQGYLSLDKERTVRVRVMEERAWLTVKGVTRGISRVEFEYSIPTADALHMLDGLCLQPVIEKTRYRVRHGGHWWDVDEFHAANEGLVVAEIELGSESEAFERPPWLGDEVSGEPRYFNSNLVLNPWRPR